MRLSKKVSLYCFLSFLFVAPTDRVFNYSLLRPLIYLFRLRHVVVKNNDTWVGQLRSFQCKDLSGMRTVLAKFVSFKKYGYKNCNINQYRR